MYYNRERNALSLMKQTEDLFPIEHQCSVCKAEFSFTSLDDFKLQRRDHYDGVYSTIALWSRDLKYKCPACQKWRWVSPDQASSEYSLKRGETFIALERKMKPLVIQHEELNPPIPAPSVSFIRKHLHTAGIICAVCTVSFLMGALIF